MESCRGNTEVPGGDRGALRQQAALLTPWPPLPPPPGPLQGHSSLPRGAQTKGLCLETGCAGSGRRVKPHQELEAPEQKGRGTSDRPAPLCASSKSEQPGPRTQAAWCPDPPV